MTRRYSEHPRQDVVSDSFTKTSRFAPIENLDICNPIGMIKPLDAPAMTAEALEERQKTMLNIFQDDFEKKKKKIKKDVVDDYSTKDFELELKKMKK